MIQRVSELTTEPIVGKFYLVECALWYDEWTPIIGPKHNDKEIGIPSEHYHKDIRFMPSGTFAAPYKRLQEAGPSAELNYSLLPGQITCIKTKRMKCLRPMPLLIPSAFPNPKAHKIFRKLDRMYVGRKVLCGKCPHRDLPLESLPKDENGHVVCNGHGLKIDMNKGKVVKREFPKVQA